MVELTKIMRQKNDKAFTELLNRVRTALHTVDDIKVLQSRCIPPSDPNYPFDAVHIWAENSRVNEHNEKKLERFKHIYLALPGNSRQPNLSDDINKA